MRRHRARPPRSRAHRMRRSRGSCSRRYGCRRRTCGSTIPTSRCGASAASRAPPLRCRRKSSPAAARDGTDVGNHSAVGYAACSRRTASIAWLAALLHPLTRDGADELEWSCPPGLFARRTRPRAPAPAWPARRRGGVRLPPRREGGRHLGRHRDAAGTPWQPDTMSVSFSTTKGVTATALHILVDRGLIDYDDPVAKFWPEFAREGKERITVRHLLCHQAGLYRHPRDDRRRDAHARLGLHDRRPGAQPARHAAGHGERVPRDHLRLAGRRGDPARHRSCPSPR